jgi:cardiolipin synthase
LCPFRPDKWLPFLAARFYWTDALAAGVKIYQYTRGFLHAKVLIADDDWASIGSANFDNRSLHLNFEMTCVMESKEVVANLEAAYLNDLADSIRVDPVQFEQRGFVSRLMENACRLMSPVL